jgi:RND family efflux transporter MFP subunit
MCVGLASAGLACAAWAQQGGSEQAAKKDPSAAAAAPAAKDGKPAAPGGKPGNAPPVSVTTVKVEQRDVPVVLKGTGTVVALTSVDVRAQTTNTIKQVHFSEGQFVKKGQPLFTLDTRVDEANLAKARAQLAKDQASAADAVRQLQRARDLFAQNFISKGAVDTAQTQSEALAATVVADQAAVRAAEVALSYNHINAPLSGRVGAVAVNVGSLVSANTTNNPPLVTITQLDPIGVAFAIPQRNLSDALFALKQGGGDITATLGDTGSEFKGKLTFVDNTVDAASGTVKVKATFANQAYKLWPGSFVQATQTVSVLKQALVVPQASIIQAVKGPIVYVLAEGKANLRPVKVVFADGNDAVVTGVKVGDRVILDGKQNVRPNGPAAEREAGGKNAGGKAGGQAGQGAGKPQKGQAS